MNQPSRPRLRALVADDVEVVALQVAELLTGADAEVVGPACDGAQALQLWAQHRPQLAVLDFNMPELTGLQVVRAIRAAERQEQAKERCRVVIFSAHTEPSFADACLAEGADHFLNKHADFERLRDIVVLAAGQSARPL
jgi:CheY-like chemotaxis protein